MVEKLTKAQKEKAEFESKVQQLCDVATEADLAEYAGLINSAGTPGQRIILRPVLAALAYRRNDRNRDFSLSKAQSFAAMISNGLWRFNHQGIAFYKDGELFDGQHRCAGVVMSDTAIEVLSTPNMDREAILTVDMSTPRTAGQALQMEKFDFAKDKERLANRILGYEHQAQGSGRAARLSAIEIADFVRKNDAVLQEAIDIGEGSREDVSDPPWRSSDAAAVAALALRGGWPRDEVVSFIGAVQQGTSESENDAAFVLHRRLLKAMTATKNKDKLGTLARDALGLRSLASWHKGHKTARTEWKAGKEPLPSPIYEPSPVAAE